MGMVVSYIIPISPANYIGIGLLMVQTVKGIPDWPVYKDVDGYAQDFVFDANVTSHAELDTYRAEGIAFISEVLATQFYK